MSEESDSLLKNLSLDKAVEEYIRTTKDRAEKSLLNKLLEYMDDKGRRYSKVETFTNEDFDRFFKTLSGTESSLRTYASKLKRFKEHIELSKKKVKENPKVECSKCKKIADLKDALVWHGKTIDEKDAENKRLHETIDKLVSKTGKVEELEAIEKEIAEKKKTLEHYKKFEFFIECPMGKGIVSLGNDCHNCNDYLNGCLLSEDRRPDLLYQKEFKEKGEVNVGE